MISVVPVAPQVWAQGRVLPNRYTWNSEHKILRIAKEIFSWLFFFIYKGLHLLAGKIIVHASGRKYERGFPKSDHQWNYERLTIEVDGQTIDAAIMGHRASFGSRKWILVSNGNGEFYEEQLRNEHLKELVHRTGSNAIVFNYPGVGASSGLPTRQAMAKAYRAVLHFLEDDQLGAGAQQIIGYGHSLGGGVQADALNDHPLKPGIKYLFIKSRTFSTLSAVASSMTCRCLGLFVKILGWNIDVVESSKKLRAPEIILQTSVFQQYAYLDRDGFIRDDEVIPAKASLAEALLKDNICANKTFIGVHDNHNDGIGDRDFLINAINARLEIS